MQRGKSVQWNKLNSLSKAVYISEQVCIRWHRTGAYYTDKLMFSHGFSVKIWGAYHGLGLVRFNVPLDT